MKLKAKKYDFRVTFIPFFHFHPTSLSTISEESFTNMGTKIDKRDRDRSDPNLNKRILNTYKQSNVLILLKCNLLPSIKGHDFNFGLQYTF